jgi:hypothetical protein
MTPEQLEVRKLEYTAAQEMLKHYDTLNWQIGSILIAGVLVMTGLVVNKDTIELMQASPYAAWAIMAGIPCTSLLILGSWWLWFRRHRDLYNLRNEVFHRIELKLGMFHYLRAAAVDLEQRSSTPDARTAASLQTLAAARREAGYKEDGEGFVPLYDVRLSKPSGFGIATFLAMALPELQFTILRLLYLGEGLEVGRTFVALVAVAVATYFVAGALARR